MFSTNSTKSESKFSFHIFCKKQGKLVPFLPILSPFLPVPFHPVNTGHFLLIESAIFLKQSKFLVIQASSFFPENQQLIRSLPFLLLLTFEFNFHLKCSKEGQYHFG